MNTTFIPSRKVLSGGIAGLLAWAVLLIAARYGVIVPEPLTSLLPAIIGSGISYIVPPSKADILRRINDRIVAIAGADPESAVSATVGAAASQALREVSRAPA